MSDNGEQPLYLRDPVAWREQLAEGNRFQPRKRVAVEVHLHDEAGRLLLVDPAYKPYWDIPGGMVEANESPPEAAARELREEIGLDAPVGALLCVDWIAPRDPWDDLLMFVFEGGILPAERAASLCPTDDELRDVRWCTAPQAEKLLCEDVWTRTSAALQARENHRPVYLHEGTPIFRR